MLEPGILLQSRYRIRAQLGQGGMGSVYHAWDTRLNVPVAIKELTSLPEYSPAQIRSLREQFSQEASVLARLSHPNLVSVTDFFEEGRSDYLVMNYVEGESLADRIKRAGAISETDALNLSAAILDALAYCHSQGVIHRDIKPANIIIRPNGQPVLVDFGLVKLWDPSDPRTKTAVRGVGTPQYAPPEQYELTTGHTEPRSDIYSFGATLYHALTGQTPPTATLRIAAPEEFSSVKALTSSISGRTASAIEKAMSLARSKRWATVAQMANALGVNIRDWQRVVDHSDLDTPRPESATVKLQGPAPSERTKSKHRRVWLIPALVIIALGTFAGLALAGRLPFLQIPGALSPKTETPQPLTELISNTMTPTLTLTLTSTPSPTVTSSPTFTATPTATPRPTSTRKVRPTPTPTVEASTTPTPEVLATTTATVAPVTSTGALIDFEQWGNWRIGDQANGEMTQTQVRVKAGTSAAKLSYLFPSSEDDYVVFMQSRSMAGTPNRIAMWVYGDGSGHFLNVWVQDANSEVWSVNLGKIGSAGWQQMSGRLAADEPWPSGHISGPDNGKVDYPVRFYAIVLDRPGSGAVSGTIYMDEMTAWTASDASITNPIPTLSAPTPTTPADYTGDLGRIILTVGIGGTQYLYTTDPTWTLMQEIGRTDGTHNTCTGGSTATTIDGQTIALYVFPRCQVTERVDACTSPDGNYKLVTNFHEGWVYDVLLDNSPAGTSEWYYYGGLNTQAGIQWSGDSRYVMFGVGGLINVIRAGVPNYQSVLGGYDESWAPQFSPDGNQILYLKPVGSEGNSDVFIVQVDGTGERNVTNAANAFKVCPRWRR